MSTRLRTPLFSVLLRSLLVVALLGTAGCMGGAWKQALNEDTSAGYYRFLRENGDSEHAAEARERLEFHKLYRNPTLVGFEVFRKQYPKSKLIEKLYPVLQAPAFDAALAQGTAEAYREFLAGFASGSYARRAEGNAVFVESEGFGGDADALARFAKDHPDSDYAPEAQRSAEAVAMRQKGSSDRVGLVLEIASGTPEEARIREALLDRMKDLTERVGIQLVEIPATAGRADSARFPTVRLEVTHSEQAVGREVSTGQLARPAMLGVTRLVLRDGAGGEVIADRRFEIRVEDKAHVQGTSVLFSAVAPKYWEEFFVPVARWRNDQTIRPEIALGRPIVDVHGVGDRAVVLYEDGDFELLGLADPTKPVKLGEYRRGEDYKKWTGVRVLGDRVAIFGEEGLELVRFTSKGAVAERSWKRGQIGRVLSIAPVGDNLMIVGAKGMQLINLTDGSVRRVMRRVLTGVAELDNSAIIFVDGESVYLSNLALLAEGRVIAQMKLGKTFAPTHVRVLDNTAIVTGAGGALVIDVRNPMQPKALSKLSAREVGDVMDATRVRGRTFLIGERGLQLLSVGLDRVEETIDVGKRNRVSVMGRHLVAAGGESVQVVDASPWATGPVPASAR